MIAWAPPKRLLSVCRRSLSAAGLRPEPIPRVVVRIERPGNSSASAGATQPGSGAASHSSGSLGSAGIGLVKPSGALARGRDQALDPGGELLLVELPDRGRLEDPARIGVDEGRTAADPVEVGEGAVAVDPHRVGPAALGDQPADLVGVVADVDREEVDPIAEPPVDGLEDILLGLAVA